MSKFSVAERCGSEETDHRLFRFTLDASETAGRLETRIRWLAAE